MFRNLALAAVVCLGFAAPTTASAYWPYGGYGYGGFGNYGWGFNQATNYVPAPPYFSIYPPVYYSSQITARHYGASPFAWSGGMQPITYVPGPNVAAAAEPLMIDNPFVQGVKPAAAKLSAAEGQGEQPEVQPLRIDNPHVASVSR